MRVRGGHGGMAALLAALLVGGGAHAAGRWAWSAAPGISLALVVAGRGAEPPESEGPAAVVARAEMALAARDATTLGAPFGGAAPGWAREWAEKQGRDDLFDRHWHGAAVRLPAPEGGTEWLGVFSMYHPVEADADHFHRLVQRYGAWSLGSEIDERGPGSEYRITHHELQVRLLPATHRMEATDRMTVRRLAGARGLMLARMNEDYEVAAVRVAGVPVRFARAGGLLAVVLPPGPPATLPVEVSYGGVVHHPGMDDVDTDVSFLFSYWYPNVSRLPATGDVTVTAPVAWTVIAEGEQESRAEAGDEARTRWRQTHPVCWLQLAAGPYQRTSRKVGDKTLNVYLLHPNPRKAEAALSALAPALPFYSRTFSPFPWTHYDVVEYPMTVGALESYSFTATSLELIPAALPHELAHSWWGGIVPNPYTVDMWNEAFATYSERLLSEVDRPRPQPGLRAGDSRRRGRRFRAPVPIAGAVDALSPPQSTVGYQKGAAVLHMFRRTVGEPVFHRVLSRFASEMSGKAATWRDFQRTAEGVIGQELGWFFDPWLTRSDAPRLRWGPARQEGGVLEAEIEMTNPVYRLRLPVAIDTADGKRRIEVVEVAGAHTHVRFSLGARALRLVLDPGADFLLDPADDRPNPWTLELPPQEKPVNPANPTHATRRRGHDRVAKRREMWFGISSCSSGSRGRVRPRSTRRFASWPG